MRIIERWTGHRRFVPVGRPRPISGIVIHNTVGQSLASPHANGSWHYQIDRDADGTVYHEIPERDCAFGAAGVPPRWTPPWVQEAPDWLQPLSGLNWTGLHVELTSFAGHPECPLDYVPYTDEQYTALRELLADLYARHGPLPIVFHREVQADRSDPVGLDLERAGLGPLTYEGHWFTGDETVVEPDIAALEARVAELEADQQWANDLKGQFETMLVSMEEGAEGEVYHRVCHGKRWRYEIALPQHTIANLIALVNGNHGR